MTSCALFVAIALCILLLPQSVGSAPNDVAETNAIAEISGGCLIGGARNKKWIQADAFGKTLKGAHKFSLYTLNGPAGEITTSKIEQDSDCGGEWSMQTTSEAEAGMAIASPTWNVMPRLPRPVDLKDTTYLRILGDILRKEGIRKPEVKISQAYKIDLDGDGKEEVVIAANRYGQAARIKRYRECDFGRRLFACVRKKNHRR